MNSDDEILKVLADIQADVTAMKGKVEKIPAIEQQLDQHGKILVALADNMATLLQEQQAQRTDIRSLHTEVHATREELEEVRKDINLLDAKVVKKVHSHDRRITNIEEQEGIENPDKN